jgi:hypothetical protein
MGDFWFICNHIVYKTLDSIIWTMLEDTEKRSDRRVHRLLF